jgi:hypothetical protein
MAIAEAAQLRTQVEFTLPLGYVDQAGHIHRSGVMRLATALDEVQPLQDPRVQTNEAYVSILLLSRVLTSLGAISPVPAGVIEGLFSADFAYLQELYMRLNEPGGTVAETQCPDCGRRFAVDSGGV